jgi:hypothetical protein
MQMKRPAAILSLALILTLAGCDSFGESGQEIDVPFVHLNYGVSHGAQAVETHVIRTAEEWAALSVPAGQPWSPDSVRLVISYAGIGCTHVGGEVSRLTRQGNHAEARFEPLAALPEGCTEVRPRQFVIGVAASDLPPRVAVRFDVPEVPPACPSRLSAQAGDYFPLELGDVWTFDYQYFDGHISGQQRMTGELRWTTSAIGECEGGSRIYTLDEVFEGTRAWFYYGHVSSEERVAWSRQRHAVVYTDSISVPYWDRAIPRFGDASSPDTLRFSRPPGSFGPGCVGGCVSGSYAGGVTMRLVRGQGMISRAYSGKYSAGGSDSETLTRLDD